jgi:methylmalonyl-CoA mutase cobalamin-binding subunit
MTEEDRHSGALSEVRQRFIFQSSRELIEELERQDEVARLEKLPPDDPMRAEAATMPSPPRVLGLPARDEADEVVAYMLAHLLRRRGISAAVAPLAMPVEEAFRTADRKEVRATFISALPPSAVGAARQMCRRLKSRSVETPVVVGVWRHRASLEELEKRLHASKPDEIVTTLNDAAEQLQAMLDGLESVVHAPTAERAAEADEKRPVLDDGARPPLTPA